MSCRPFAEVEVVIDDGDSDIEHIWQLIYRFGFYRGGPVMMSALSGIDIALWDLKGTAEHWRYFFSITDAMQPGSWEYRYMSYWEERYGVR